MKELEGLEPTSAGKEEGQRLVAGEDGSFAQKQEAKSQNLGFGTMEGLINPMALQLVRVGMQRKVMPI
ncbi:hypothetical protein [Aequorivita antarctica]|uniref:Uncharacterized protein n=1 Tax=Aequorivita antarctica TaxID=153266 RepID=A0A5C6YWM3_9FLAO|nr:hypothetical protein [Aequorivita antarctica]TXD71575.1 hypothetical protein ESU54_16260 [Aequorivita antarctica]SRX75282.1 hypothetical protein AEQU3_02276 [Aequorivita antarctica]